MRNYRRVILIIIIFIFLTANCYSHLFPCALSEHTVSVGGTRGVIIVDWNGTGHYSTIQAAVDNASEGDTIRVLPGTYNESITINKSLDLVGSGVNDTTIEGGGIGDVIHVNCDDVNISGFFINGSGWKNGDAGIELSGSENCYIGEIAAMNCLKGIYLNDSNYNLVVNNSCWDNEYGIYLGASMHNGISENMCDSNTYTGISLFNSYSNMIESNTCTSTGGDGISISYSEDNEVINNTCNYNHDDGIFLGSADSNSISNNNCEENWDDGIFLEYADSNSIFNNNCDYNWDYGIHLYSAYSNLIENNTCGSYWEYGIYIYYSDNNKILNSTCNSNNYGIYLYYSDYNRVANSTCNSNEYGIYLDHSDYTEMANNTCNDNYDGIYLDFSNNNKVKNNTCDENSDFGIYFYYSDYNDVASNTCNSNYDDGVHLYYSEYNDVASNTCNSNYDDGVHLYYSEYNDVARNTCDYNNDDGIYLTRSDSSSIFNNICEENRGCGIVIYSSDNIIADRNICNSNYYGMQLYNSEYSEASNNTCNSNDCGIDIYNARYNEISSNTCDLNDYAGIHLRYSNSNSIYNNSCGSCWNEGIYLYSSDSNSILTNTCKSNGNDGILLSSSLNNNITGNTCEYNENGIHLGGYYYWESSNENKITNNLCSSNQQGIRLDDSDYNQLLNNTCNSNTINGTYLLRSYNNNLDNNTCVNNTNGISLEESGACNVTNSTVLSNTHGGIILTRCVGGNLTYTTCSVNGNGLSIDSSHHINITNNSCQGNEDGISASLSSELLIANNSILRNGYFGISLSESDGCTIRYNLVDGNSRRNIKLADSYANQIDHNDFVHHNLSVTLAVDEGSNNHWDDGKEGNYWSDYSHLYPDANEMGKTWDTPYEIVGGDSRDDHPLCFPVNEYFLNPIACAGPDLEIEQHREIVFNSTGCFDYVGIENYTWMFSYNGTIRTMYGSAPVFTFHVIGTYDVVLRINSTRGRRDIDSFTITVIDVDPPAIDVPQEIIIDQHETVQFDAGNCTDNGILDSYIWTVEYDGEIHRLFGVKVLFTYHIAGDHRVVLWVNDSRNNSAEAIITVSVRDITPPVAHAGDDATIDQYENAFLDAGASTDNVGIFEFVWSFQYANRNWTRTGVVMIFKFSYPGIYEIVMNASDEAGNWDVDTAFVTVRDITDPIADAGGNLTGFCNEAVKLNGTLSEDNVCIFNYTWSFPYHSALMMLYGPEPAYIFREAGTYAVTLHVRDMAGNTANDTMFVFVRKGEDEPVKPLDDDVPDVTRDNTLDSISDVYICSALIFIAIILVVISDYIYRRMKRRKGGKEGFGSGEEPEIIADLSDTLFAKRTDERRRVLYEELYGEPWKPSPRRRRNSISGTGRDGIYSASHVTKGKRVRKKIIQKRVKSVGTEQSDIAPVEVTEYIEEDEEVSGEKEDEDDYGVGEETGDEEDGPIDVSDTLEWGEPEGDSLIWLEDEIFGDGISEEILPNVEGEEYKKGFMDGYRKALESLTKENKD